MVHAWAESEFVCAFLSPLTSDNRALEYSLQRPTPIIYNTFPSYFPHLKTCITTSRLCTTPTLTRTRCQKSWTHKLSTLWRSLPTILYALKIKLNASPASPALPCFSSFCGAQGSRGSTTSRRQASPAGERETTKEGGEL